MASIPVSNYTLNDVLNITGGQTLGQAFAYSNYNFFHPSYRCSMNRLLDFRCYTEVNAKAVNFCVYDSYGQPSYKYQCACIVTDPPMSPGESFSVCMYGDAEVDMYDGYSAYSCVWSSGGYLNLFANVTNNYSSNGTCFEVVEGATYTVLILSNTEYGCTGTASAYIGEVISNNGCFCQGNTSIYVQTGY